jgi:hypothetical protein
MKRLIIILAVLAAVPAAAETFNIEIDYMVDNSPGSAHSHMPSQAVIDAVVQMFACQGHTLNIVVDDALPHHYVLRRDPSDNSFFDYSGTADSFGQLKADWFDNTGGGWHYAIFAHRYENPDTNGNLIPSGSSGLGERPGDDFIVTLGAFTDSTGNEFQQASTLAHEFGHNLGLTHCGGQNCDSVGNNSPVLASIMSYNYQLEGLRTGLLCNELIHETEGWLFKEIDYSRGRMASLQEAALDEALGTSWVPVDWDCSGSVAGVVSQDLSSDGTTWCDNDGDLNLIGDYNEWDMIVDVTKNAKSSELVGMPESEPCMTFEDFKKMQNKANCPSPTTADYEPCISAQLWFVDGVGGTNSASGTWQDPSGSLTNAQIYVPSSSAVVLFPGTLDEGGAGGVVLDRRMRIYSAKGSVIK